MLNKARLLSSLRLDPTHPSFPHTSLLHAICAFAAVFCSSETLGLDGDRLKYWETEKTPRDYHYACAREEIDLSIVTMSKGLFQVSQCFATLPSSERSLNFEINYDFRYFKLVLSVAIFAMLKQNSKLYGCSLVLLLD